MGRKNEEFYDNLSCSHLEMKNGLGHQRHETVFVLRPPGLKSTALPTKPPTAAYPLWGFVFKAQT